MCFYSNNEKKEEKEREMKGKVKGKQLSHLISGREKWVRLDVKCKKELLTNWNSITSLLVTAGPSLSHDCWAPWKCVWEREHYCSSPCKHTLSLKTALSRWQPYTHSKLLQLFSPTTHPAKHEMITTVMSCNFWIQVIWNYQQPSLYDQYCLVIKASFEFNWMDQSQENKAKTVFIWKRPN